ncbi:M50 family metallopeptidase [Sphingomonas sp.]|uniref:M50 family metallopeptidase n=1 Tax=Sphingomonas sp. TaxID=28214 RepID=UPI00286AFB47|nr:M50 family metallopeptidase [Sphingomonas sp.]
MLQQPSLWIILLAFICVIGPLIFIHELGHYLVAKLFGVGAEEFSIGFGREIVGWTDRSGTRWKVGWLPLGGFVRFVGDMNPASAPANLENIPEELRSRSMHLKPVWQRFLIVLAGPAANFLLAILIFAAFFATFGMPLTPNVVASTLRGGAAEAAGIQPGDRITSIAGRSTSTFEEIYRVVVFRPGEQVKLQVERDGKQLTLPARIAVDEQKDRFGQRFRIGLLGINSGPYKFARVPPGQLIPRSVALTVSLTRSAIDGLWQIISGRRSIKELGGPLKIAQIAGQQATLGPYEFIQLLAVISINLGFINLLPVPVLDGGHLFFYAIEAVRRRPVSLQAQDWAFRGGLALVFVFLLTVTFNDLGSFGLWDRLGRLIG